MSQINQAEAASVVAEAGPKSISGQVFLDSNSNAQLDSSESGLPGFRVYLDLNGNGSWETEEPSIVTDETGVFNFSGLAAREYKVREVQQQGWIETLPTYTQNFTYTVPARSTIVTDLLFGNVHIEQSGSGSGSGSGSSSSTSSTSTSGGNITAGTSTQAGGDLGGAGSSGNHSSSSIPVTGGVGGGNARPNTASNLEEGLGGDAGMTPDSSASPTPQILGQSTSLPVTGISAVSVIVLAIFSFLMGLLKVFKPYFQK